MLEILYTIINGLGSALGWVGSLLLWILKQLVLLSLGQMFLAWFVYFLGFLLNIWEYFFPPKPRFSCLEDQDRQKRE